MKKTNLIPVFTGLLVLLIHTGGLRGQDSTEFLVGFYNVENLFDLKNDPATLDDDFTPGGAMKWNKTRYTKKLQDLARVISEMDSLHLPDILGLCETENRAVLEDLVGEPALEPGQYGIAQFDSPDARGIDVALLYRKEVFRVIGQQAIPVVFPFDTITTRDILYVKGLVRGSDTLHVFVNHWSSRREGEKQTERRRIYTAVVLRRAVDSIMNYQPGAKILVMGDFNDEPTNMSLHGVLNANNKRKNASPRELYNLMYDMNNLDLDGSYNFRGNWNMLDQIIVSRSLLDARRGLRADFEGGKVMRKPWMMFKYPDTGQEVPNRTYGGPQYYGGISDHLPVYTRLLFLK